MNGDAEKTILITDILENFSIFQKRLLTEGDDEEKRWMIGNATNLEVVDVLKETTVQMLHVIDSIGELGPVNGITISKNLNIPRGSISKITQRLVNLKIIYAESVSSNKKEVLFRLSSIGQEVFKLHQQLHKQLDINIRVFLSKYSLDQMRFLSEIMSEVSNTSWVESKVEDIRLHAAIESFGNFQSINEILSLIQYFDSKKLSKVKELIRVAFLDD